MRTLRKFLLSFAVKPSQRRTKMSFLLANTTSLNNNSTILIVWSVCIGVCLGYVINFISKATEEKKAVTLGEIGFLNRRLLKVALRNGSSLRGIVSVVGGELAKISSEKRAAYDFEKARLYIHPDKRIKAEITYGKGEKWYVLLPFITLAIGCAYGMSKVMPLLVDALFK